MNPLNKTHLEGNLLSRVSLSENSAGYPCASFRLTTFRAYRVGEGIKKDIYEFDIEVYGRAAEICAESLEKGDFVRIDGRLKQDRWIAKDPNTGEERQMSMVKVVAERVDGRAEKREERT